jgi:hypothetical protein
MRKYKLGNIISELISTLHFIFLLTAYTADIIVLFITLLFIITSYFLLFCNSKKFFKNTGPQQKWIRTTQTTHSREVAYW